MLVLEESIVLRERAIMLELCQVLVQIVMEVACPCHDVRALLMLCVFFREFAPQVPDTFGNLPRHGNPK